MPVEPVSTAVRDAFLASSPPRVVPQKILQRVAPWQVTLAKCVAGGVFLIFGLILSFLFVPRHLPQQWRLDRGPVEFVQGKIISAEKTGATENETAIWKYGFAFRSQGDVEQRGTAHTTGKTWGVGSSVEIRYLPSDPRIASPVGARLDRSSAWTAVVLIFPLFGFYCLIHAWSDLKWKKRLLSDGLVGKAVVDSLEKSRFHSEGQDEYILRMTRVEDGVHVRKRIRTDPEIRVAEAKLKSGEPLVLLHEKNKPERCFIVESWDADTGGMGSEPLSRKNVVSSSTEGGGPASDQETVALLEMPPPRRIPKAILTNVTRSYRVPLSLGLLFFMMSLVFTWVFFPFYLTEQWRLDAGPSKTVPGKVLTVKNSKMQINHVWVKEHRFTYQPENGERREGIAYTPGGDWEVGTPLRVRYLISEPGLAVPEGARLGDAATGGVFILIFPLGMAVFFFGLVFLWSKDLQILRMGALSTARITSVEKLSTGVQGQHKIHVVRAGDEMPLVKRTHDEHEITFAKWRQDAGEPVKILHLDYKSKRFLLPEVWNR